MENAADALKMSAAILVFILAIASSFSLFGTAKQTADSIINMRDKQAYLEAAELDTILYTSSDKIKSGIDGYTTSGDRIVTISDVFSTIYRYSIESYGVTIINGNNGKAIARFDSATEAIISNWNKTTRDENNKVVDIISDENKVKYIEQLKSNLKTTYIDEINIDLEELYRLKNNEVGVPWLGNSNNILERINKDIYGGELTINQKTYVGKDLINTYKLDEKTIVEVTNEIDQSQYLEDENQETNLLQQYNMPTVEIVYIIIN